MSAAKAICDHMRDWWQGTNDVKIKKYLYLFYIINIFRMNMFHWV